MQTSDLQGVLLRLWAMPVEDSQRDVLGWAVADPHAARYLVEPPSWLLNQQACFSGLFPVV